MHTNTNDLELVYDVIILGSGLVGLSLALFLDAANSGLKCLVLDENPEPSSTPGVAQAQRVSSPEAVSAINHQQWQALLNAGLDPTDLDYCPIERMYVRESQGAGRFNLESTEAGLPAMSYTVANQALRNAILKQLKSRLNCDFLFNAELVNFKRLTPDWIALNVANQKPIRTRLLVGADGAKSKVRALQSWEVIPTMAPEKALVATFTTEKSHDRCARQVFLESSVLAFLPLVKNQKGQYRVSIVWSGDENFIADKLKLEKQDLLAMLNHHAHALGPESFGCLSLCSELKTYPIVPQLAEQFVAQNLVLIGDAAHGLHPLAGQGANLGMVDAVLLAQHLTAAHKQRVNIAYEQWLKPYARGRHVEARMLTQVIKSIHRLFRANHWLVHVLRNQGVNTFDSSPVLKRSLMTLVQRLGSMQ